MLRKTINKIANPRPVLYTSFEKWHLNNHQAKQSALIHKEKANLKSKISDLQMQQSTIDT